MAGYNEILTGRFNRFIQKLLSMKGPAALNEVGSVLQPSVSIFNGVENRYLEGWDLFGAIGSPVPVAAQLGSIRLRNPVGSNVIAVIQRLTIVTGPTSHSLATLTAGPTTADLGTIQNTNGNNFDSRGRPGTTCVLSFQTTAAAPPLSFTWEVYNLQLNAPPYAVILENEQEIPLLPGSAIQVNGQALNAAIHANFFWRERPLEDSELR